MLSWLIWLSPAMIVNNHLLLFAHPFISSPILIISPTTPFSQDIRSSIVLAHLSSRSHALFIILLHNSDYLLVYLIVDVTVRWCLLCIITLVSFSLCPSAPSLQNNSKVNEMICNKNIPCLPFPSCSGVSAGVANCTLNLFGVGDADAFADPASSCNL